MDGYDGPAIENNELLLEGYEQLVLLMNTGVPTHWGPSGWGLLLGASSAALLLSFGALLSATRPVEAIFSFLALLLSLLLPFFSLEAEYVAAIHLMVYPGAILIFFSFATLTTDQQGHWDHWNQGAGEHVGTGGNAAPLTIAALRRWGSELRVLLVALPLLALWWSVLRHRLGGSPLSRSGELVNEEFYFSSLPAELERSSDLVALGLEIFQRRLLSLTLLGLLLLLAFLTALELLAPQRRRRSSSLFPRLGAWTALPLLPAGTPLEVWTTLLGSWNGRSGDAWLLPLLPLLALGLAALSQRRYAFLHSFLLLEALGLLLNLFFVVVGSAADDLGGSVLVLFSVAVAAAETAVGLALFLALSQGNGGAPRSQKNHPRGGLARRRLPLPVSGPGASGA